MIVEFFGPAGAGKTKIMLEIAHKLKKTNTEVFILRDGSKGNYSIPVYSLKNGHGISILLKLFIYNIKTCAIVWEISAKVRGNHLLSFITMCHMIAVSLYGKKDTIYLTDHGFSQYLLEIFAYNLLSRNTLSSIYYLYTNKNWLSISLYNDKEELINRVINSSKHSTQKKNVDLNNYYDLTKKAMRKINSIDKKVITIKNDNLCISVNKIFDIINDSKC